MGEKLKYWVGFNMISGIGPIRLKKMLEYYQDVEAAWMATREELQAIGLGGKIGEEFLRTREALDLQAELDKVLAKGYKDLNGDGIISKDEKLQQNIRLGQGPR